MYTSTPADVPDPPFRFFEGLVLRLHTREPGNEANILQARLRKWFLFWCYIFGILNLWGGYGGVMRCCKVAESGEYMLYISFAPPMHYTHLVKIWDCDYLYAPFFFTYYKWREYGQSILFILNGLKRSKSSVVAQYHALSLQVWIQIQFRMWKQLWIPRFLLWIWPGTPPTNTSDAGDVTRYHIRFKQDGKELVLF